jgi:predicted SAM-dependent methyltransferase
VRSLLSIGAAGLYRCLPSYIAASIVTVGREIRRDRRHRKSWKRAKRLPPGTDLRLNVGCGSKLKPGWINIDVDGDAEFNLDVRRDLPFADASVSIVYSEHFFEHLEYFSEAQNFLREALRVLRPGGLFSVAVPDASLVLKSYVNGDYKFLRTLTPYRPDWSDTPMHHVNHAFRQRTEHKYSYDFDTLASTLLKAGFATAERRTFDPELDGPEREFESLYVDARKAQ